MRTALEMALAEEAEVIVLHVVTYSEVHVHDEAFYTESLGPLVLRERRNLVEEFLAAGFSDLLPRVELRREVHVGVPYKKIVECAAAEEVDLIVMSTHGRTGLAHVLVGSVTEKVVQHAACPVLSIRPAREVKLNKAA